jgi:drug/metabolite transporter (DMT)-like permease
MTLGLLLLAVPIALATSTDELTSHVTVLLVVAGATNVIGLGFEYRAFRLGKVGVVTAIASTEGIVVALISIAGGAHLSLGLFVLLLVITSGVAMAAAGRDRGDQDNTRLVVALSIPVALAFGVSLYATGEIGGSTSVLWTILPARAVGTVAITLPLALRRELKIERRVMPLVAAAATGEVLGFASYVWGSRSQLSIAAVLASEYAALAAIGAYLVFHERLGPRQLVGLSIVAVGVGVLSVVRAT